MLRFMDPRSVRKLTRNHARGWQRWGYGGVQTIRFCNVLRFTEPRSGEVSYISPSFNHAPADASLTNLLV